MVSDVTAIRPVDSRVKAGGEGRTGSSPVRRASNTFFKLLYRYTHSRAFRHNERLAHGVTLRRDTAGRLVGMTIRGQSLACVNASPQPLPMPDECHLIATGPSVLAIDYSAFDMRRVMGVNGAIALKARHDVRFDYYCIVDTGFVRNRPDLVEQVIGEPLTLFATPLVLWHIAQRFAPERIRCRVFLLDDMLFPAGRRAIAAGELRSAYARSQLALFEGAGTLGFSLDVRHGVFDGCTVAYSGLQILASLGFARIYLHGVDLVDAARTPRFYESAADRQPSWLDDHFHAFIEPSFRHAAALLKRRGTRVFNLSPASALGEDIFPKLHWRSLAQAAPRDLALA